MKKQSSFALILLSLVSVAVVILIVGLVSLQRISARANQSRAEYLKISQECRTIDEDLQNKKKFYDILDQLNSDIAKIDSNMVDYAYIPTYLKQLQATTMDTGCALLSIRPRDVVPLNNASPLFKASYERWKLENPVIAEKLEQDLQKADEAAAAAKGVTTDPNAGTAPSTAGPSEYRILQVDLDVSGTYVDVIDFMNALRNFPKMVYLHSVGVTPTSQQGESGKLTVRMETYAIITPDQFKKDTGDALSAEVNAPQHTPARPEGGNS